MNIISEIDNVISLCKSVYQFYDEVQNIDDDYKNLYNDVIILETLITRVKLCIDIPPEVNACIKSVAFTLSEIIRKLKKYQQETLVKKVFRVGTKKIDVLTDELKIQKDRIELLLQLKRDIIVSSRFNVGYILKNNKEAREFWEMNFGSENLSVPFSIFIQMMEEKFGRMRKSTQTVLQTILDIDHDNSISAYEYNLWIESFGGNLDSVVIKTLNSLFDVETRCIFSWFHGNIFGDQAKKKLSGCGFGSILVRFSNTPGIFVVYCIGLNEELCEFDLKAENDAYKLLPKKEYNITENIIIPFIEPKAEAIIDNIGYFRTLSYFIRHLENACKTISKKFEVAYEPVDWNTGTICSKYYQENDNACLWINKKVKLEHYIDEIDYFTMPVTYETWRNNKGDTNIE